MNQANMNMAPVVDAALAADVESALNGVAIGVAHVPGASAEVPPVAPAPDALAEAHARLEAARAAELRSRRLGDAMLLLEVHGASTDRAPRVVEAVERGASWSGALFIGAGILPQILRRAERL
ncbi:MAG TPA: hypothetical protein VF466_03600 [Candidatus Saccharimonadales bacterium]